MTLLNTEKIYAYQQVEFANGSSIKIPPIKVETQVRGFTPIK